MSMDPENDRAESEDMTLRRYEGHGDLDLAPAEYALLRAKGFEPWGSHAWVWFCDHEQGGTVYDDRWALAEAVRA